MPYDYNKLIGRIIEKFSTRKAFAIEMGMSEHTLSEKLNGKISWKQSEISLACKLLDIADYEIPSYFFTMKVQSN